LFLNVQRSGQFNFKGGGAGQFFAYQPSEELPHAGKTVLFNVLNYRKKKEGTKHPSQASMGDNLPILMR